MTAFILRYYGFAWVTWLANLILDGQAGYIHQLYLWSERVLLLTMGSNWVLVAAIFFNYGTE